MIDPHFFTTWLLVMFPLVYSPGPGNTLFAANGAAFGFRRSLPLLVGIDAAFILQSLLVGLGVGDLLLRFPTILMAFKVVGIAYIVYLGCTFLKAASSHGHLQPRCLTFYDGVFATAVNPKAWTMQLIMFSQFLHPGDDLAHTVLTLTAWLAALNVSGHIIWILCGSALISRAAAFASQRAQNTVFAAMLFGSVWFLI